MDLAKIRKKSLLARRDQDAAGLPSAPPINTARVADPAPHQAPVPGQFGESVLAVSQTLSARDARIPTLSAATAQTVFETPGRTPLEVILSGRRAAGCIQDSVAEEEISDPVVSGQLEYLSFRVSDEIYGINILDIKEIIKPREVTVVPRTPAFLSGVLSLRGTIIPVIDMRERLGLQIPAKTGRERIVVIKSSDAFCGLMVDEILQVMRVDRQTIEPAPAVLDGIERDFIAGIGRSDDRLLILLNLEKVAEICE